ncbi:MAG: GP88 family protein [Flavobacteriaceae bacterium]
MNKKEAIKITGGLSKPSKMPGFAYNLPATRCKVGSKLAKVKGSVCHGCYALKGRYRFPNVKEALERRYKQAMTNKDWVFGMVYLINTSNKKEFRWHDAGDIQSAEHLQRIFQVCELTPSVKHWLPTRESVILSSINADDVPDNLIIRLSASKVDGPAPKSWPWTSTVVTKGKTCPAAEQNNECKDCRACWDKSVKNVAYGKH